MSFEKLKKGLHIYFGIVIFMVLLFSVCGMVDKNSNSPNDVTNSNDVSKTESGLIGKWESIVKEAKETKTNMFLEIKNDNTIKLEIKNTEERDTEQGGTETIVYTSSIEGKIININSTARQFVIDGQYNSIYDSQHITSISLYYLSDDKKELVIDNTIVGTYLGSILKRSN